MPTWQITSHIWLKVLPIYKLPDIEPGRYGSSYYLPDKQPVKYDYSYYLPDK